MTPGSSVVYLFKGVNPTLESDVHKTHDQNSIVCKVYNSGIVLGDN